MNRKQIITLSAIASMTMLSTQLRAADAEVKVKADTDRPKAEIKGEIDRDANGDLKIKTDRDRSVSQVDVNQDRVRHGNKASGLLGMEIRNRQNEKLGEIKDLVMDLNSGKVSYAVLSVGGFLGIGEKLIAIPPGSFTLSDDGSYLTVNADKARIQAAPGFAATSWPSVHNPEVNKFWNEASGGAASGERDTESSLKREKQIDIDVDKNGKSKIYTDADKDKKVKIEVEKN